MRILAFFNSTAVGVFLLCVLASVADTWSSWMAGRADHHIYETNPLTRNLDFSFNLSHGIGVKFLWLVFYGLTGWVIWEVVKKYDRRVATLLAMLPWLVYSYVSFQAAVHNCMLVSAWYVPGP